MIQIRQARAADAAACHALDLTAWGELGAASEETFLARIEAYAPGNHVAIDAATGVLVGSIWTVAGDARPLETWWKASGQGRYIDVCNPAGEFVFGVSVAVLPGAQGPRHLAALIEHVGRLSKAEGKRRLSFGVPIKDFHRWHRCFSVENYARVRRLGGCLYFLDPASNLVHRADEEKTRCKSAIVNPQSWDAIACMPLGAEPLDTNLKMFGAISIDGRSAAVGCPRHDYFMDEESLDFGIEVSWIL